jgi:hypothetical protein
MTKNLMTTIDFIPNAGIGCAQLINEPAGFGVMDGIKDSMFSVPSLSLLGNNNVDSLLGISECLVSSVSVSESIGDHIARL